MALTEAFVISAVTVGATELSIVSGTTTLQTNTDDGAFQLWIDAGNLVKGDIYTVRIYEKVKAAGTKKAVFTGTIAHVQSELWCSPVLFLMHGWDMTLQKSAGSDQAFDASIRKAI